MNLSQQIKNYYFERAGELPEDKRFHFGSRIAAWDGDPRAYSILESLKVNMIGDDVAETLKSVMDRPTGRIYGKELRQPFFDKYPKLFGVHNALFRVRHLLEIYGMDVRKELLELVPPAELEQLRGQIMADSSAIRILSRFAVDYLYLLEILFGSQPVDTGMVLKLGSAYDLSDKVQRHLFIYLFTHCIIADSNFYKRAVTKRRLPDYHKMLSELETIIENKEIKLDCKYEFLVAGRICGYVSKFQKKITEEAEQLVSPDGTFIVDPLIGEPNDGLNSLAGSEHRNVLFIMSQSSYRPIL